MVPITIRCVATTLLSFLFLSPASAQEWSAGPGAGAVGGGVVNALSWITSTAPPGPIEFVVGGSLTSLNSQPCSLLCRVQETGGVVNSMGTTAGFFTEVTSISLVRDANSKFWVGGANNGEIALAFSDTATLTNVPLARATDDLPAGTSTVSAVAVWSTYGSTPPSILVGGKFSGDFGTTPAAVNYIGRWDGTDLQPVFGGVNGDVYSISCLDAPSQLCVVGGTFTSANSGALVASRVAYVHPTNGWSVMHAGTGMDGAVYGISIDGPSIYLVGAFNNALPNTPCPGACRFASSNGNFYNLPTFTGYSSLTSPRFHTVFVATEIFFSFGPGDGSAGYVHTYNKNSGIVAQKGSSFNGKVSAFASSIQTTYAGGSFTSVGSSTASGLVALLPPSATPTPTISLTPSPTPTTTVTISPTPTISVTPTISETPSISLTPTISVSVTPTWTPTVSPSDTPTVTVTVTTTVTPSPTISETPSPTVSDTPSPTSSTSPTYTPSPTGSTSVVLSASPSPSPTLSLTPSNTPSPSTSPSPSAVVIAAAAPATSETTDADSGRIAGGVLGGLALAGGLAALLAYFGFYTAPCCRGAAGGARRHRKNDKSGSDDTEAVVVSSVDGGSANTFPLELSEPTRVQMSPIPVATTADAAAKASASSALKIRAVTVQVTAGAGKDGSI